MKLKWMDTLLWIFISIYIFYFGLISLLKFNFFGYHDFDFAVHVLSIWNILHGSIFNSILGIPFLGNHVNIILFLVAPIYAVFNHPLVPLFLQTIALGLGALPLYKISERVLDKNWGLVISIMYLFYPALGYTNLYEFHPTVFATFFLISAFYYYDENSFLKFMIFASLSMLCQENIPLVIVMFGVLAVIDRKKPKWIIVPIFTGSLYFLIAVKIMSHFNKDTIQFFALYRHLGTTPIEIILNIFKNPSLLFKAIFRKQCGVFLVHIFLPVSFIPLFSPLKLILPLPFFMQHMLSGRTTELTIFYHYIAEIIPFVFISSIYGIRTLLNRKFLRKHQWMLKTSFLSIVLLCNLYIGPHFKFFGFMIKDRKDYMDLIKDEFIAAIPSQASAVTTFEFLPHLSHRRGLYSFHHVYIGFYTLSNKAYRLPSDAEYAILDFNDYLTFTSFYTPYNYRNLQKFLFEDNWQILDSAEDIVLFRKDTQPSYRLCEMVQDISEEIGNRVLINVEDDIELIGYNFSNSNRADFYKMVFYWRSLRTTEKDINIFLDIVDAGGNLVMRKFHPICYRFFPTNSWVKDQVYKELYLIKIPPIVSDRQYRLKIGFFDFRNKQICRVNQPIDNLGRVFIGELR